MRILRWLMKLGKLVEAFRSMSRLRSHPIIAARDFHYSWIIYQGELREGGGYGYFSRLWACFAVPRIRRANYGASTVLIAQQMCGINSEFSYVIDVTSMVLPRAVIAFYSSTIFQEVGYTKTQALYASLGYGAILVLSTIPTLFLIDTKARRTLALAVSSFRGSNERLLTDFINEDFPLDVHIPAGCWIVASQP